MGNEFAYRLLTFLERREERLLTWGFYNVRQTAQEIDAAISSEADDALRAEWATLQAKGAAKALLQAMEREGLLHLVPGGTPTYRTRFAEGVRLIANLRQMFTEKDWATGSRLVSDIKLKVSDRSYPRRDRPAAKVWESLRPYCPSGKVALMEECFFALARKNGKALEFSGFQERAFGHILRSYGQGEGASAICAGTGSGKTKAFYLPAFLRIASELGSKHFTKVIAVYPRNVLLEDQLREAIAEAEKIRPILKAKGLRPIRFGALLGSTPHEHYFRPTAPDKKRPRYYPKRIGNGHLVPFLKSPDDGRSDLFWKDSDRNSGKTCLYREGKSTPDVQDGVLAITRQQIQKDPPDILFLSVEMLNKEMGNPDWASAFGFEKGADAPRLLLIDEAHTCEGAPGAQVSWVLRRWRYWASPPALHVVGLSATLRDAAEHVSQLVGLPAGKGVEFRPSTDEMETEGAEYNLAIKGDPAAGTSLLSTTIQTGMLLARLLTPRAYVAGAGLNPGALYRRKVFGFTDDLDAVNRWFGYMDEAERNRLAKLRLPLSMRPGSSTSLDVARRMDEEGQIWNLPCRLGYDLSAGLAISRTSSQDPGANPASDLIVATSSLEVGYDDPDVGGILHHKRPRSMSSFIQRKGRAGRTRGSRPWTLTVLSDYGADRWMFQHAERLFLPEVDTLSLPVGNPYVLKVQIALFLVDWIGKRIRRGNPFDYLAGPSPYNGDSQKKALVIVQGLLDAGPDWNDFYRDLLLFFRRCGPERDRDRAASLLNDLLWQEPRALIRRGLPALLRELEKNWARSTESGLIDAIKNGRRSPMPQFIPSATFMELEISDGRASFEDYRGRSRDPEALPLGRLLREACPGNVSKRYATMSGEEGYWSQHSPKLIAGANVASIAEVFQQRSFLEAVGAVQVFQPESVSLIHRPGTVADSSDSSWDWNVLGRTVGSGEVLPANSESPWREAFLKAEAFTHANGTWIEILRYAQACRFEILKNKQYVRGSLSLESKNEEGQKTSEAVGFRVRADGVRFVLSKAHLESRPEMSSSTLARFRPDYLQHLLKTSVALSGLVNSFQAAWMADISVAMLAATATSQGCALSDAQKVLSGRRPAAAAKVLDAIFQLRGVSAGGQVQDAKVRQRLLDLWSDPKVVSEVCRCEEISLWGVPDASFKAWSRQRYIATIAQAVRAALASTSKHVDEEDFLVDVPDTDGDIEIFVTETSSGGLGQIEAAVAAVKRDPRRFLDGLEHSLSFCPRSAIACDLSAVVAEANEQAAGSDMADAFTKVRRARGFDQMAEAGESLKVALEGLGVVPRRSILASVVAKVIRPGSSSESDALIHDLNRAWRDWSSRISLHIPLRAFAYLVVHDKAFRPRLQSMLEVIGDGEAITDLQMYAQVQQMLIEDCPDSCPDCLDQPNWYAPFGKPSRRLASAWLELEDEEIPLNGEPQGWQQRAKDALRRRGRVCLLATGEASGGILAEAAGKMACDEIDVEEVILPTYIARVSRSGGVARMTLALRGFLDG